ncbi:MAG: FG-GAP-like repeat-containing protein [Rhodothermales bacterium]
MSIPRHALSSFSSLSRLVSVFFSSAALCFGVLIAGSAVLSPIQVQAQGATSPQAVLQQANQMIFQGRAAEAITALESLTESQPQLVPAWATLGRAYSAAERYDEAAHAYERAHELSGGAPGLALPLGSAVAMTGNVDRAFELLREAERSGRVDITSVGGMPGAAVLSADPRWAELMPSAEEFAHPFVEPMDILLDVHGETQGDVFGWIARRIGDVDGDGVADFTTNSNGLAQADDASSGAVSGSGSMRGRVYTYSSRTGELLWSATGTADGGRLGMGIEAAGDVNADGIPDVVAGAPFAGEVFVWSGSDGTQLHHFKPENAPGRFGSSVRGVGDINGDGYGDIVVGEPGGGNAPGRAHVFSGQDGSLLMLLMGSQPGDQFGSTVHGGTNASEAWILVGAPGHQGGGLAYLYKGVGSSPAFVLRPDAGAGRFGGMFMSVVGDVNADGTPDLYVADWADSSTAQGVGKIYVFSGVDGSVLLRKAGEAAGDGFGIGVADTGDVNGDGHDDLLVGAWQHASAAVSGGKLYLLSGKDGELLASVTGNVPGETLGFDTTHVGDVDGDGHTDFLVTSAYSAVNGYRSGRVFILSGASFRDLSQ